MNDNTQNDQKFFDLHTMGIGYLYRARTVTPKNGKAYMAVSIAAFHGCSDDPAYTYIDTRIVGSDALDFVKRYEKSINEWETKVLVRFKVGDGTPDSYEAQSGKNKGKRLHVIKARLLQITWAKVNDDVVLQPAETEGDPRVSGSDPSGAGDEAAAEPQAPVQAAGADTQPSDQQEPPQRPAKVELDPNDPEFEVKRTRLKKQGYRWNRDQAAWVLSEAA